MNSPIVSVIISTVGRPKIIGRAITSILCQSFKDFELIIGDVSKTVETKLVIDKYMDHRIKYIKIEDEIDPAVTINSLISSSVGEFIAFCDDDDEWSSHHKLAKQVGLIRDLGEEYGIVYCWYDVWDDSRNGIIELRTPSLSGFIFPKMLGDNVIAGTPNLLIRKSLFDKYGGWETGLIYSADHLMLTKLSQYTKVSYVPEVLVRVHHNHQYGRQTNLGTPNFCHMNRIVYQKHFLQLFAEDFKLNKWQQIPHLRVLINDYIELGDTWQAIMYIGKYMSIVFIDKYLLKSCVKLFLQMFRSK